MGLTTSRNKLEIKSEMIAERLMAAGEDPSFGRISSLLDIANRLARENMGPVSDPNELVDSAIAVADCLNEARLGLDPSQERARDLASMYRFEVERESFKSAEDAMRAARSMIYISDEKHRLHLQRLARGESTTLVYGFKHISIDAIPVPLNENSRLAMKAFYGVEERLWDRMRDEGDPNWRQAGMTATAEMAERWLAIIPAAEVTTLLDYPFGDIPAFSPDALTSIVNNASSDAGDLCL